MELLRKEFLFNVIIVITVNLLNVDFHLFHLINYIEKSEFIKRNLNEFFPNMSLSTLDSEHNVENEKYSTLEDEIEKLENLKMDNYKDILNLHKNKEKEKLTNIKNSLKEIETNNNEEYNNEEYNNEGYNNEEYNNEGYNNEGYNNEEYNNEEYNNEKNINEENSYEDNNKNTENNINNPKITDYIKKDNENEIENEEDEMEYKDDGIENGEDEIESNESDIENKEKEEHNYNNTEDIDILSSNNEEKKNSVKNNMNEINKFIYNQIKGKNYEKEKKKKNAILTNKKETEIKGKALNNNKEEVLNVLKNEIKNNKKNINSNEKYNNNVDKKNDEVKEKTLRKLDDIKILKKEPYGTTKLDLNLNKLAFHPLKNPLLNNEENSNKNMKENNFPLSEKSLHYPDLEQIMKSGMYAKDAVNLKGSYYSNPLEENKNLFLRKKSVNRPVLKSYMLHPYKQINFYNSSLSENNNSKRNIYSYENSFRTNKNKRMRKLGQLKLNNDLHDTKDIEKLIISNLFNYFLRKNPYTNTPNFKNQNNFYQFGKNETISEDELDKRNLIDKQDNNIIFTEPQKNKKNPLRVFLRFFPRFFNNPIIKNEEKKNILEKNISKNGAKFESDNVSKNPITEKLLENLKSISVNNELNYEFEENKKNKKIEVEGFNETDFLNKIFKGVVKLYVDITGPSIEMLWQNKSPKHLTGSGFVIEGNLILTNAHNITYSTRILVRKHGNSKKYESKVIYVTHEADIAILVVQDPSFYKDIKSLELGSLPSLRDDVITVGYPSGGDKLSITKGIISRIDVQYYKHSNYKLLLTQIDAPINPGNSGGPALVKGKVVGICFQSFKMANNISYIIPTTIIKHFLLDIYKTNRYNGFAMLGIKYEALENPHIRETLGLTNLEKKKVMKENVGILITEIDENQMKYKKSDVDYCNYIKEKDKKQILIETIIERLNNEDECYGLKKNDVILSVDGKYINNDGTTKLRNDESVGFQYLFNEKFMDDLCIVQVVRNKNIKSVVVKLSKVNYLVSQHNWDKRNKYFVYGGLVFTTLSKNLYAENDTENPEINRLIQYNYFKKNEEDEIVLLKNILPSKLTIGYYYSDCIVLKVKNIEIKNLKHLVDIVENENISKLKKYKENNPYIKYSNTKYFQTDKNLIDFYILTANGEVPIVLNKDDVQKYQSSIFKLYNITNDRFLY